MNRFACILIRSFSWFLIYNFQLVANACRLCCYQSASWCRLSKCDYNTNLQTLRFSQCFLLHYQIFFKQSTNMKLALLSLAATANAHTLFTTFFVNGQNQGDGTCVREPKDGETATAPIFPITGDDMACGMITF